MNKLYRITILFATIPLLIGVILFLSWYLPRRLYAIDCPLLEAAGAYCFFSFIGGLVIAFLLLIIWWIKSKTILHPKAFLAISLIIVSFIIGYKLLLFGLKMQDLAFVSIQNRSGQNLNCRLYPYFKYDAKTPPLKDGKHRMFVYQPAYDNVETDGRNLQLKKAFLEISKNTQPLKLFLPPVVEGTCARLIVNNNFQLEIRK